MSIKTIKSPIYNSFELTHSCHINCPGCIINLSHKRKNKGFLRPWKQVIDALKDCSVYLRLTGGEPTLHPEFLNIVNYLKEIKLPFLIFTCGSFQNITQLTQILKETETFLGFLVSLHGDNEETFKNFTQQDNCFNQAIKFIEHVANSDLPVYTTTVLCDKIADRIEKITKFAIELGVTAVHFNRYLGRPIKELEISEPNLISTVQQIEDLRTKGVSTLIGNCIPQCFVRYEHLEYQIPGLTSCTITPDGTIQPGHFPLNLGNILEQSIEEIWVSKRLLEWLQDIPEECKQCVYVNVCPGGSRALANYLKVKQDPLIRDPITEPEVVEIELSENLIPNVFEETKIRREKFGYLLYNFNTIYPINKEGHEVIKKIFENRMNVGEFNQLFGFDTVNLIGELYHRNMIELI